MKHIKLRPITEYNGMPLSALLALRAEKQRELAALDLEINNQKMVTA